jgi:hypothetical protein
LRYNGQELAAEAATLLARRDMEIVQQGSPLRIGVEKPASESLDLSALIAYQDELALRRIIAEPPPPELQSVCDHRTIQKVLLKNASIGRLPAACMKACNGGCIAQNCRSNSHGRLIPARLVDFLRLY